VDLPTKAPSSPWIPDVLMEDRVGCGDVGMKEITRGFIPLGIRKSKPINVFQMLREERRLCIDHIQEDATSRTTRPQPTFLSLEKFKIQTLEDGMIFCK